MVNYYSLIFTLGTKPEIVGYACAALNSKDFYKKQEVAWIPEMCKKYPEELTEREDLTQAAKVRRLFLTYDSRRRVLFIIFNIAVMKNVFLFDSSCFSIMRHRNGVVHDY